MGSISSPIHEDSPNHSRSSSILLSSSQIHLDNNNETPGEGGKLRLKWDQYPQSLVNSFRDLKEEEDFVDVTLACNSQQFNAHKVVLSACSPYFRKLLKSNPCHHPIIILRDVVEIDIESLLKFMYNGEVQISEDRIKDFLKTAESLQIRGLAEQFSKDVMRPLTTSLVHDDRDHPVGAMVGDRDDYSPIPKRHRLNGSEDSPMNGSSYRRDSSEPSDNNNTKESLLSQALEKPPLLNSNNNNNNNTDHDDSASDDAASERHDESMNEEDSKMDIPTLGGVPGGNNIFPPGLEALYRQAGFPPAFLGGLGAAAVVNQGHSHGGLMQSHQIVTTNNNNPISSSLTTTPPIQSGGLQSHSANPTIGGKLEMMRVRATDPRPCPKCSKIYRSAHTLRTHMEDKHTVCPGYRCVLCGTVAKSRNSLHSHMSRQHRGISTKDLPVVPMPAPFDAALASQLFNKAGVKVTPTELAARASPTAPRRSDLPKLDSNFLHIQQQHQFPLPPSIPVGGSGSSGRGDGSDRGSSDAEDLRVPSSSPYGSSPSSNLSSSHIRPQFNPKDLVALAAGGPLGGGGAPGLGSALLDTYLSMINAAGENNMAAAAAALNFHHMPAGRAALAAAAAAAGTLLPSNGDKDPGSDREDMAGELGSDADNEDLSDTEDGGHHIQQQQVQQVMTQHDRGGSLKEGMVEDGGRQGNP
uniref:Putative LOC100117648 [Nasonia vitripennis] n=2 Tax=Lepeophtheirus salmonis TaxID=72036 RepID=A0A0K2UCI3_LEPSM